MDVSSQPSTSQATRHRPTPSQLNEEEMSELQVKCHYMNLLDEVESIENANVVQNISKLNRVVDKVNQLFPQVTKSSHMYWDAKVIHSTAGTMKDTCNNVDVGEGNFKLFTFAEQLKVKSLSNDGRTSWETLAAVAQPVVHNSLPCWSPLLGSFELQADITLSQQKKERKRRAQKDQIAEKKEPEKLRSVDKTHEGIDEIVQDIHKKLRSHYKRNGKRPIRYFQFVINPKSFASTVENIFHVSFLVNDGFVKLELDDDEPVIIPVVKGKENSDPQTNRQATERQQNIFSIDTKTWRGLVGAMKVNEAMI